MLRLEALTKRYGSETVVDRVSFEVDKGAFVVLIGASGSGKTTTLKMINRLLEPSCGRIFLKGRDVLEIDPIDLRRGIGYVFQEIGLFPHYTIFQNVATVPRLLQWGQERIRKRVEDLLELVGLDPSAYGERFPAALSGGQKQRVGLARALAARPELMLMDEPLGALDPILRLELRDQLLELHREFELTTIMVTHDMTEALQLADQIGVLREGRLLQFDSPAMLIRAPADSYVEDLLETPTREIERLESLGLARRKRD